MLIYDDIFYHGEYSLRKKKACPLKKNKKTHAA
jgi:hypothetical protein